MKPAVYWNDSAYNSITALDTFSGMKINIYDTRQMGQTYSWQKTNRIIITWYAEKQNPRIINESVRELRLED